MPARARAGAVLHAYTRALCSRHHRTRNRLRLRAGNINGEAPMRVRRCDHVNSLHCV